MTSADTDLEACAREPIHIPGAIQPHGALFSLDRQTLTVLQASANISAFAPDSIAAGEPPQGMLAPLAEQLREWREREEQTLQLFLVPALAIVAHKAGDRIVVEMERAAPPSLEGVFLQLRSFARHLAGLDALDAVLGATARYISDLTGFDRVLVYRFDEHWNGEVMAEEGNGRLPSYLGLRFPAADIPAQARRLYAENRVRIIPDAGYQPVPILPADDPLSGAPLDLSFAQLRSVSPIHLEYMRNMGTGSSMSVSIMVEGRLWGLVACHGREAHMVPLMARDACDFVTQCLAMRIAAHLRAGDAARRVDLARVQGRLLAAMARAPDWLASLSDNEADLLALTGAAGAAVVTEDRFVTAGETPTEEEVRRIAARLGESGAEDVHATASLPADWAEARNFAAVASGLIAVRISELHSSWLMWFRPEVVRTVTWGGNPHKQVREDGRIHPRHSFDAWKDEVRLQAAPWSEAEITAARDFRSAVVGIVLRKAEELAELSGELQRSNKELEAFSYSISHDLRAPFRHIVGFAQLLRERETALDDKSRHYLRNISESALSAGRLVDDLLNFSQLGRAAVSHARIDMDKIVSEVRRSVMLNAGEREIEWSIGRLPVVWGDAGLLRQVWYNLIDNAVKYTRPRNPARIGISGRIEQGFTVYEITDNGVGFDMAYSGKLFGVFQRLQRAEDFEGTGIGLALVRRIVERHNGSISAQSALDKGAVFVFRLPLSTLKGPDIA